MTIDMRLSAEAEKLAARFPPLMAEALRVAATVAQGVHGRRRAGSGDSFWQFRHYDPADPARMIDWRKSAKSDHTYVREKEWETAQTVYFWCDRSGSMDYRSAKDLRRKQDYADLLQLALCALLLDGGERIGLIGSSLPVFQGRASFPALAQAVLGQSFPLAQSRPLPQSARIVLISDFLFPLEKIGNFLGSAGRGRLDGDIVQIMDPAEIDFPFGGHVRFEGMEGEVAILAPQAHSLRDEYQARITQHQKNLEEMTRRNGLRFHALTTIMPPEKTLLDMYLSLEERRRA